MSKSEITDTFAAVVKREVVAKKVAKIFYLGPV